MNNGLYKAFCIDTLTNTHVGSGDVQFGVVDNVVQRDPVTEIPIFHSSSVKGAIREHFINLIDESNAECGFTNSDFEKVFGGQYRDQEDNATSEEGKNQVKKDFNPGRAYFFDAHLLTLPLRASKRVFYQATSKQVLIDCFENLCEFIDDANFKELLHWAKSIPEPGTDGFKGDFFVFSDDIEFLEIEDFTKPCKIPKIDEKHSELLQKYFNISTENLAIFHTDIFKEICADSLPVIARNKIGNDGISENLFYEEVLPRRTKLLLILGQGELETSVFNCFCKLLTAHKVQFGASFSIGYGQTRINEVIFEKEGNHE